MVDQPIYYPGLSFELQILPESRVALRDTVIFLGAGRH